MQSSSHHYWIRKSGITAPHKESHPLWILSWYPIFEFAHRYPKLRNGLFRKRKDLIERCFSHRAFPKEFYLRINQVISMNIHALSATGGHPKTLI